MLISTSVDPRQKLPDIYQKGDFYIAQLTQKPKYYGSQVHLKLIITEILHPRSKKTSQVHIEASLYVPIYIFNKHSFKKKDVLISNSLLKDRKQNQSSFKKDAKNHLVYSQMKSYHILERKNISPYSFTDKTRYYIIKTLKNSSHLSISNAGIISALLIGVEDDISTSVLHEFRSTGTIHILAVSGMHVAILLWIIQKLGAWIDPAKKHTKKLNGLSMLIIWNYAILAGLSASIVRASLMSSLYLLGKILNLSGNLKNAIYSSAFLLLCWDSEYLYDLGFQLSYAAVIGIAYVYPILQTRTSKVKSLIQFQGWAWLQKNILEMLCLTLSAQLTTSPLIIYYFHQFPSYFLCANLLLIPWANMLLYYAALSILASLIFPHSKLDLSLLLLEKMTSWMIHLNHKIAQLPLALIENIYINTPQLCLVYLIIICMFLKVKKRHLSMILLLITICLLASNTITIINHRQMRYVQWKKNEPFFYLETYDQGSKHEVYFSKVVPPISSVKDRISIEYMPQRSDRYSIHQVSYKGYFNLFHEQAFYLTDTSISYIDYLPHIAIRNLCLYTSINPWELEKESSISLSQHLISKKINVLLMYPKPVKSYYLWKKWLHKHGIPYTDLLKKGSYSEEKTTFVW